MFFNPSMAPALENNSLPLIEKEVAKLVENCNDVLKITEEKKHFHNERISNIRKSLSFGLRPVEKFVENTLSKRYGAQQQKVEEFFRDNPKVEVESFSNTIDGTGTLDLSQELKKAGEKTNKVVILMNGIISFTEFIMENPAVDKTILALMRLYPKYILDYGLTPQQILKGNSVPHYLTNTTQKIQEELFQGEPVKVMIVRNASIQNLKDTVDAGGGNTVLVVQGHGNYGGLLMTDGYVASEDFSNNNENKLKAYVQHACGGHKMDEEMGQRFAQKTYGLDRDSTQIDYIENPLPLRSDFTKKD